MKFIALIVAMLSGWVISNFLLDGTIGPWVSVLFAYHFFLAFLLGYMDWSGGFNLPLRRAAGIHLCVLIFLCGFIASRSYIPGFDMVAALMPAIAFLEVEWVFGKQRKHLETDVAPGLPYTASQQDYSDFLHYLKQPVRPFAKAGRPVQEEYSFWLADRAKQRAASKAAQKAANGAAQNPQAQ